MTKIDLYMKKLADGGIANDTLGSSFWGTNPIGWVANPIGGAVGFFAGKPTEERLEKWDKKPGLSWLPGVGQYRKVRKIMDATENKMPRGVLVAEHFGPAAQLLALSLVGGNVGAKAGGPLGAVIGAGIGSTIPSMANAIGTLIGKAKKRRTEKEQAEADNNQSLTATWLLPGYAGYTKARRMPSITRREDIRNAKAEKQSQRLNNE